MQRSERYEKKYGKILQKLRTEKGVTQKEVAEILGITTSYYGMIEQQSRRPTIELAFKISKYFNKNIEDIFF